MFFVCSLNTTLTLNCITSMYLHYYVFEYNSFTLLEYSVVFFSRKGTSSNWLSFKIE